MPGGFHPFHAGHLALYQSAVQAFPGADVKVAATNDTSTRPFPFALKEKLAQLAGVAPGNFYQVKSPFRAEEITKSYNPATTQLIFVRSEKDANKLPQAGGVKRDGAPAYLQPISDQLAPMTQHAYMVYLPTVEFGPGMTSATEIRSAWPTLTDRRKTALVMSLYPKTQRNPKLAAVVVKMLDTAIGTQEVDERSLKEFAPGSGGDDDIGDDPYKYPKPERYRRSADYFGQFEADHFDREAFDDATGEFKGYWGRTPIAYFKFDNPARTGSDDPGRGWYYEPQSNNSGDDTSAEPADDNAEQRKQQELGMIRQFLKSGNRPNPDSQIGRLMKKHGIEEDLSRRGFLRGLGAAAAGAVGVGAAGPAQARSTDASRKEDAEALALLAKGMTPEQVAKKLGVAGPNHGQTHHMGGRWASINRAAAQLRRQRGLNEFAMGGGDDDGNDGFSDDTLKQLAAQWYNGDEDPRVEQTLAAAGWEIGQDEGYDDTPGVFVVQAGDINGNSYISWPAHELEGLAEASKQGVAENFADGKNPQDKGDAKRHGINTKASVSSLRKTAKQGGRKGQLAHWLANMKAGRAKNEDITEDNDCPPATQDISLNLKNRQKAINEYGYGPLNPDLPNTKFWMKKVDEWNLDSMEEAQSSLCGNCAAFDIRQETLDCIAQGIDSDSPEDAEGVIDAGDLGYCKFLKFKCASRRTCDAWVTGGPLEDKPVDENQGWAATYQEADSDYIEEKWSAKYKSSINCANPKGFSQKAHCAGRKK